MNPLMVAVLRRYAPYLTLPFAAVVGIIGYNIENILSDKYTPYNDSIKESRKERMLTDEFLNSASNVDPLQYKENVFSKNIPPSLQQQPQKH